MSATDGAQDAQGPAVSGAPGQEPGVEDVAQDAPTGQFGPALRKAREQAGLSVADVANTLKVTELTVDALEDERYEDLPPRPYIRGYVQRYARLVGLDAGTLTVGFDTVEAEPRVVPAVVPRSRWALFADFARDSWGLVYGTIVFVFVILIGGALWWAWPGGDAEQAASVAESAPNTVADSVSPVDDNPSLTDVDASVVSTVRAERDQAPDPITPALGTPAPGTPALGTPAPGTPAPAAVNPPLPETGPVEPRIDDVGADETTAGGDPPAPDVASGEPGLGEADAAETTTAGDPSAGPDVIAFVFEGDCWVEVRDRTDNLLHGDLGRDGDTVTVRGNAPFSILVGNVGVVDIAFNGQPVALDSAASGEVARLVVGD